MAEINDELADILRRVGEELTVLNSITISQNKDLQATVGQMGKYRNAIKDLSQTLSEEEIVRQQGIQREKAFDDARKNAVNGLKQFNNALLDTTSNFAKYEGGIKSFTSAISDVAGQFGPLGKAVALAATGLGALSGAILKQTDAVVKGYDELSKFGGSVGLTADGIFGLGKQAGFTSSTLGTFTKNVKEAGGNLIAFGGTASQGVKAFTQFVAVGDDQLKQYRRLGYSQDELIEAQTQYLKQSVEGGRILTKSPQDLQKASLAYIDELNVLADLTGISVKKQQEAQNIANSQEQFNLFKFAKSQEIFELDKQEAEARKVGNTQRADEIKAQKENIEQVLKAKDAAARLAVETMSQKDAAAFMQTIVSDRLIVTEQNANMVRSGRVTQEMLDKLKKGTDVTGDVIGAQTKAVKDYLKNMGDNAFVLGNTSGQIAEIFGVNLKTQQSSAQFYKKELDTVEGRQKFEAERIKAEKDLADKKLAGGEGQRAIDAAAARENIERQFQRTMDSVINALNPFTGSVAGSTLAVAGLTAAAAAAAIALARIGSSGMAGGAMDMLKKALPGAGTAGSALAKGAAGLSKFAGPAAGVIGVGMGAYSAYEGYSKAEEDLKNKKISEEQAKQQKAEAIGGGAGMAAGGAGGAWAGAAAGAALGSVVPVIGTAIGGILGAALGGWLGSQGGEVIGKSAAKALTQDSKVPKMAKGGIIKAKQGGQPIIAGEAGNDEIILPLTSGKFPLDVRFGISNELDSEQEEQATQLDDLNKDYNKLTTSTEKQTVLVNDLNKEFKETDTTLGKLVKTLAKWEEHTSQKLSEGIDVSKIAGQVKFSTPTGGGTGITPGSMAGTGIKLPPGEQQQKLMEALSKQGITGTTAVSNILAQVQAESGFRSRSEEVGKYSPETLFKLYGPGSGNKVRFNTLEDAKSVVAQGPEAVGNLLYGGRMGNLADEGYKYRGRGLIQLTGKSNYEKYGKLLGLNLVDNPDLANDPDVAAQIAALYFKEKEKRGVNLSDIGEIGKAVGYAGGQAETAKRAQLAQAFSKQLPQAQMGGIFSGPMAGYPVEMHGNELVAPLDPNSLISKLLTASATEAESIIKSSNTVNENFAKSDTDISTMVDMLSEKMDSMIERLTTSNDLQDRLVKYSSA